MYSTLEETEAFNMWYYEQVENKYTKSKLKNLKEMEDDYKYLYKSEIESSNSEGFVFGGEPGAKCWSRLQTSGIDQKGQVNSCTKTKAVGELYDNLSPCTAGRVDEELVSYCIIVTTMCFVFRFVKGVSKIDDS